MPRYSAQSQTGFRPLTSAHRQTVFLRNLSDAQYSALQEYAKTAVANHVHPQAFQDLASGSRQQVIWALWQEHDTKYKRGEKVGGGLADALHWTTQKVWQPLRGAWNYAANSYHYFTHDNTISDHTRFVAKAISETYNPEIETRQARLGDYQRIEKWSTDWVDVWKNDATNQILCTVRGSRDASDFLVDDVGILAGTGPRDLVSSELRDIFKEYGDDYDIETAGHSLGGSLLALALSNNDHLDPVRINFFNPGTSPLPFARDAVNHYSSDDRAYYYMNAIDPVSFGELAESPTHLLLHAPVSWTNPVENHILKQWIVDPDAPATEPEETEDASN